MHRARVAACSDRVSFRCRDAGVHCRHSPRSLSSSLHAGALHLSRAWRRRSLSSSALSPLAALAQAASTPSLVASRARALTAKLDNLEPSPQLPAPEPYTQIFCNRDLRLDRIDVIGFDYDFTLASYKFELQELIYELAKRYLLDELSYPTALSAKQFDRAFAIRGLAFDRRTGVLAKLSYAHQVAPGACFHGRRRLSHEEACELYGAGLHVSPGYVKRFMTPVNDLFALSEACLLADVVQLAIDANIPFDPASLGQDVSRAIGFVHKSGNLHETIAEEPERFIHPVPGLRELLQRCRASGKQLFLLTNSPLSFVDKGLRFLYGDDWRETFDAVVISADKPSFYHREAPFRSFDASGRFVKWSQASADELAKGRVLLGGSIGELTRLTGWRGSRVLYVGDHLHTDLLEPRRKQGWTTGAIIRELEHELLVQRSPAFLELDTRARALDTELRQVAEAYAAPSERHLRRAAPPLQPETLALSGAEGLELLLDALEEELRQTRRRRAQLFNVHFGSVFRTQNDSTAFAFAVKQYVDVYTARIDNLLQATGGHRFYPTRRGLLPHEFRTSSDPASSSYG